MKKLLSMVAVAALVLTGCGNKELNVETIKDLVVEYGDKLDTSKLFDNKKSDEKVKVEKVEGFDDKKLGKQELTITFTDGDAEAEKKLTIEVKDTKKPEITLNKDEVTITAGDKLDVKSNIKSVKDSVDGDIKYSDKTVEKNGYCIDKGKLNTNKAGIYEVKVVAYDKNGNKTEKSFKVEVKKKKVAKKENNTSANNSSGSTSNKTNAGGTAGKSKPSSSSGNNNSNESGTSNKKPSNSGNGNSNSNSGSSSNKKPNQQQQDPNKITRPLGNTGWVGTREELDARARAEIKNPDSPWSYNNGWCKWKGWTVNASGTLWTVEIYK